MTFAARFMKPRWPRTVVIWLALWLTILGNLALWRELVRIAPEAQSSTLLFPGVFVFVFAGMIAFLALTAWGRPMKPLWIAIVAAAGVAQHFMLGYGVVMDTAMLANTMQTDAHKVRDHGITRHSAFSMSSRRRIGRRSTSSRRVAGPAEPRPRRLAARMGRRAA